jgi:hypothetical protein
MNPLQFWYLPLAPAFFFASLALVLFVFVLLPLGLMQYAYEQLGVSLRGAVGFGRSIAEFQRHAPESRTELRKLGRLLWTPAIWSSSSTGTLIRAAIATSPTSSADGCR